MTTAGLRPDHVLARIGPYVPVAALAVVPTTWLASADGGYFPQQWGWPALGVLLVAATAVLVLDDLRLDRLEWVAVGSLVAYTAWVALSILWSPSAAQPVLEVERTLLYAGLLLAVLLLASRRSPAVLVAGVLATVTGVSGYALATRLVPDAIGRYPPPEGYQLAVPLGYWNALGIVTTMGVLLAVGAAAHAYRLWLRTAAAAALVVLAPTLYFTFSRGSLLALGVGAAAMAALDPHGGRLAATALAVAPAPALAVLLASRSQGLTREGTPLAEAAREGHRLAALLVPIALLSVVSMLALAVAERRLTVGRQARRAMAAAAMLVVLACLGAVVARAGDPIDLLRKEVDAFTGPLQSSGDLNSRLLNVSGNGRADYWRVAWKAYEGKPWLGVGAGGYEREWLLHRPTAFYARDAHNLYLETLAELGPVGLILLLAGLGAPWLAALRARHERMVVPAAGAYTAFLVHAGLDWDWELPAVTAVALLSGAALLVAARNGSPIPFTWPLRTAALALLLPMVLVAFTGHMGNGRLARSFDATARGETTLAAAEARSARHWQPWSFEPWQRLGEAQLAAGDVGAARRSFREALKRDPRNWGLWYGLAAASTGAARAEAVRAGLELNPRSPELAELQGVPTDG